MNSHDSAPPLPGAQAGNATAALVMLAADLRRPARDGDCLTVAPRVTWLLRDHGIASAVTVAVTGWIIGPRGAEVIMFMHQATAIGSGWIIDLTAQQFDPDMPDLWTATAHAYTTGLAAVTGAAKVTVTPSETV